MKTIEEKAFDLLEEAQLNWSVEKEELVSKSGKITSSYGVFKNEDHLGTVGKGYVPYQNSELAMTLLQATEGLDIEMTRGGSLLENKKVYLQAQLPNEFIGKSNVNRWITCLNSHDGSTALGFGSSNTVVVCRNTFYHAYGDVQKFRHTSTMKQRIEIARNELQNVLGLDVALMNSYKVMADLPLRDEAIERVLAKIFKVEASTPKNEITTQKENKIVDFADALQSSVTEQGSTIWALFNGITRFANHISAPADIVKQMDYVMLAGGSQMMNNGYDLLVEYCKEQVPEFEKMITNN